MLRRWRNRWRPLRRRLRRRLGLGRQGRRGLEANLRAAQEATAHLLRRLHPGVAADAPTPPSFLGHECRLYSQNGEDGLLLHIFSQVGVTDRRFVEFGVEDGRECLARTLVLHFGWTGMMMDCETANIADAEAFYRGECGVGPDRLAIVRCLVTAENIDAVLRANGFTGDLDFLSIDIDGNDYWVWKAIEAVRPRVVAIEYNASFGLEEEAIVVYDPAFDRKAAHPSGWYHGASLAALVRLGARRGYALVGGDASGVNAFFVRRELLTADLPEVTAKDAWRPHRSRSRRASAEDQLRLLRGLPLVRDP